jgi:hypothetical protein
MVVGGVGEPAVILGSVVLHWHDKARLGSIWTLCPLAAVRFRVKTARSMTNLIDDAQRSPPPPFT